MAEGVRLDLQVGLDIAYLQNQLSTIGTRLGGQTITLPIEFSKRDIVTKTKALQKYIGNKTFDIKIESNTLTALANRVKNFKDRLDELKQEDIELKIKTGTIVSLSKRDGAKVMTDLRAAVLGDSKKLLIPTSIKPSITRADVRDFTNAVKSKLSGLSVKVKADLEMSAVRGGAKSQAEIDADVLRGYEAISRMGAERMKGGGVTEAARREQLKQRLSTGEFDISQLRDIGAQLGVKGAGRFRNVQNLIEKIVAEASVEMIKKYLDPQAVMRNPNRGPLQQVLDTFARGVFHMLGMDPAVMKEQARQKLLPPAINWPAQIPPPRPFTGPSSTGRLLTGAAALPMIGGAVPAGLLPSITQRTAISGGVEALLAGGSGSPFGGGPGGALVDMKRIYAALQKHLDEILQRNFAVVEVDVRETSASLKTALHSFSYLVQALRDAETRAKRSRVDAAVDSLMKAIEQSIKVAKARLRIVPAEVADLGAPTQRMLQGQRVAGLLPAAGGTTPIRQMRFNAVKTGAFVGDQPFMRAPSIPTPFAGGGAGGGGGVPPRGGGGSFFQGMGAPLGQAIGKLNLPGTGTIRDLGNEFSEATKQVLLFGTAYKALAFITGFPQQVGNAVTQLQSFRNTLNAISPSAEEAAASNRFLLDLVDKYNTPLEAARSGFTKLYASMQPAGFSGEQVRDLSLGISQAAAAFGMSADKVDRVNYAFAQMASKGQVMSEELKGQLGDVLPGAMAIFAEAAGLKGPDAIQKFSAALEKGVYKAQAMTALLNNVGIVMREKFGPGAEGAARTFQGVINRLQNSLTSLYESFEPVAVGFLNSVVAPLTSGIKDVSDGFKAFFSGTNAQTAGGFAIAKQLEQLRPTFEGIRSNVASLMPVIQNLGSVLLEVGRIALQLASNPIVGYLAKLYVIALPLNMALNVMRGLWAANALQLLIFQARVASGTSVLTAFRSMMAATGATAATTAASIRGAGLTLRTFFATTGIGLVVAGVSVLIERFMSMNQALADTKNKAIGAAEAIRNMTATQARSEEQKAVRAIKVIETLQQRKRSYEGSEEVSLSSSEASLLESLGIPVRKGLGGGLRMDPSMLESYKQRLLSVNVAEAQARQRQERQAEAPIPLATIPPAGADGKPPKSPSMEGYYSLQDQLAKNFTEDQIRRIEQEYQARVNRINAEFDIREARANSFHKEAIQYERKLSEIALAREKAVMDASNEVLRAREGAVRNIAGGSAGAYLQGNIGPTSTGPHFDVKRVGGGYFPRNYLDPYVMVNGKPLSSGTTVPGGTFAGHQRRGSHGWDYAFGSGRHAATLTGGAQWMEGKPTEHGERRRFKLPSGEIFQFLHGKSEGIGAGTPRGKVGANERRDTVSLQKEQLAIAQKSVAAQTAEAKAIQDAAVAWAQYSAAIAPIEEQQLQNSILAKKNELMKAGLPEDAIDKELKYFEAQEKTRIGTELLTKLVDKKVITLDQAKQQTKELQERLAQYNIDLAANIELQKQQSFDATMSSLRKQLDLAGIVDPREERRAELMQGGSTAAQANEQALLEERISQAKRLRDAYRDLASSIGDAFGNAFKGLITGSMTAQEALGNMFQSIANSFADMVAQMIAEWMKMQILGIIKAIFSAGVNSITSAASPEVGAIGQGAGIFAAANGGVAIGGFKAFASGGVVTGPTLGLVGEGRYNEAIVPLPDGKSIPVELNTSMFNATDQFAANRAAMNGSMAAQSAASPFEANRQAMMTAQSAIASKDAERTVDKVISASMQPMKINYETQVINNVEYVTSEQFQRGMNQAAEKGRALTMGALKNSVKARRQIGI